MKKLLLLSLLILPLTSFAEEVLTENCSLINGTLDVETNPIEDTDIKDTNTKGI